MKRFACGDVVPACTHTFLTSDLETMLAEVAEHALHAHAIESVDDATIAAVLAHVHEDA